MMRRVPAKRCGVFDYTLDCILVITIGVDRCFVLQTY
jgi:hypothetical protein